MYLHAINLSSQSNMLQGFFYSMETEQFTGAPMPCSIAGFGYAHAAEAVDCNDFLVACVMHKYARHYIGNSWICCQFPSSMQKPPVEALQLPRGVYTLGVEVAQDAEKR